jgi:hypothetical protein
MLRRGFTFYDWKVDAGDAVPGGGEVYEASYQGVCGTAADRLMHDSAGRTRNVEALVDAIRALLDGRYGFDRLTPLVRPVSFAL